MCIRTLRCTCVSVSGLSDAPASYSLSISIYAIYLYQLPAFKVMAPAANWTVSPFATPVMDEVSAPCSQRSAVAAASQISMDGLAGQVPVAFHDTALLLTCTPADGAAQNVAPSELLDTLPAVYPYSVVISVPLVLSDPCTVISRRWYGGVMTNADPPPVPGVIVNVEDEVNRACKIAFTRALSVMLGTGHTPTWMLPRGSSISTGRHTVHPSGRSGWPGGCQHGLPG